MYDDIGTQYQLAYAVYKHANIEKVRRSTHMHVAWGTGLLCKRYAG